MTTLDQGATDVILRDGSTLRLRAPLAADADAVLEFFATLSDRSRYLRFHGFPALGPRLVAPFLDPDWDERGAPRSAPRAACARNACSPSCASTAHG